MESRCSRVCTPPCSSSLLTPVYCTCVAYLRFVGVPALKTSQPGRRSTRASRGRSRSEGVTILYNWCYTEADNEYNPHTMTKRESRSMHARADGVKCGERGRGRESSVGGAHLRPFLRLNAGHSRSPHPTASFLAGFKVAIAELVQYIHPRASAPRPAPPDVCKAQDADESRPEDASPISLASPSSP